jgi:Fur family ferric uptake transcriptional regulator
MSGPIGVRTTRQRAAVIAALDAEREFRSAQDLHRRLLDSGHQVGLTTVYRTLQALADAGDVDLLRRSDGEMLFRACSSGHHHHLVCRACGRTVEVDAPDVEAWAESVARAHRFTEIEHTVEIFGRCADCG